MAKEILLTGDRPTGKLHIGHYIGSLKNRVKLQNSGKYDPYIMIADTQALTDNARNPEKIRNSLIQVALDYLAVGIDPAKKQEPKKQEPKKQEVKVVETKKKYSFYFLKHRKPFIHLSIYLESTNYRR